MRGKKGEWRGRSRGAGHPGNGHIQWALVNTNSATRRRWRQVGRQAGRQAGRYDDQHRSTDWVGVAQCALAMLGNVRADGEMCEPSGGQVVLVVRGGGGEREASRRHNWAKQ